MATQRQDDTISLMDCMRFVGGFLKTVARKRLFGTLEIRFADGQIKIVSEHVIHKKPLPDPEHRAG